VILKERGPRWQVPISRRHRRAIDGTIGATDRAVVRAVGAADVFHHRANAPWLFSRLQGIRAENLVIKLIDHIGQSP
jgi:hypothetical protein